MSSSGAESRPVSSRSSSRQEVKEVFECVVEKSQLHCKRCVFRAWRTRAWENVHAVTIRSIVSRQLCAGSTVSRFAACRSRHSDLFHDGGGHAGKVQV